MTGLAPISPEMEHQNMRVLADRLHWPDGALYECERIERIYPEWRAGWMGHCAWNKRPAGFYAWRQSRLSQEIRVYGVTAAELEAAIEGAPPPWEFKLNRLD